MRVRRLIIGSAVVSGALLASAVPASAAPIECPGGQTATKVSGGWDCVNKGGNPSNAEDPKNPKVGKGFSSPIERGSRPAYPLVGILALAANPSAPTRPRKCALSCVRSLARVAGTKRWAPGHLDWRHDAATPSRRDAITR